MRAKEIVLLVLLVLAGTCVYQVQTGRWWIGWDDGDEGFAFGGRVFTFEERLDVESPPGGALEVENGNGAVEIRAGNRPGIEVVMEKRIRRRSEEQAREIAGRLRIVARRESGRVVLAANRDDFDRPNFSTRFTVLVPAGLDVAVRNAHGPVTIEGTGRTTVANRHGRVFCGSIGGPLEIEIAHDDVRVERASGDTRISGRHAAVDIFDVGGDLRVEIDHGEASIDTVSGSVFVGGDNLDVRCVRAAGPVEAETSHEPVALDDVGAAVVRARYSDVDARNVRGGLSVTGEHGSLTVAALEGDLKVGAQDMAIRGADIRAGTIDVATSYKMVELLRFSGAALLRVRNGDVLLEPRSWDGPLRVENEYSTIRLVWPAGAEAPFTAASRGGDIEWGLATAPAAQQSNGEATLRAFVEAPGPAITLSTTYGDIRVVPRRDD